jgi:phage terminase large subunit GpA-like protein
MDSDQFGVALADVCSPAAAFRPPRRVTVAEGIAEHLFIKQPGGYVGPWNPDETTYMVEPANMLASRRHEAVIFVGPARSGKTMALVDGWGAYAVACDPGDMLTVQMTQEKAREFSKTRVDRMLRHSPSLHALMSASAQADNTHDKLFRHGMWWRIGWPTVSQVSSSDYRYVAMTDYDRIDDNIGGEGALFALGLKRTQTFLSRGMAMAESSPGRDVVDPNWKPVSPHEAPPCGGILGLYNGSDRRRWYWQCPHCRDTFEAAPGVSLFGLPDEDELLEIVRETDLSAFARDFNRVLCPHCSGRIGPHSKHDMNRRGRWIMDGQTWLPSGEVVGDAIESTRAGYWLGGVAATYQSWHSIVLRYLQGLRDYALTGEEEGLKVTTNTDQGMPYTSRALLAAARNASGPEDRKEKSLERYVCPPETRFLVATVDNQGGTRARFVVQVHAVGPDLEKWIVDRYEITESMRDGADGGKAPLDPARYLEDWDTITEKVVRATYRTQDATRELRVLRTVVDTAGEDGVTEKAYAWYRKLRLVGLHKRVVLSKGASDKKAPLLRESMVGGRSAKDKGDVPLHIFNPNLLKDTVSHGLKRERPGPGYIHLPAWPNKAFFDELQSEVRQPDGTWMQIRKRNETFDLLVMARVGILVLGAEKIRRWERAPAWAAPLAENSEAMSVEERRDMKANERVATVPEVVRPPAAPQRPRRRVAQSSYVRG